MPKIKEIKKEAKTNNKVKAAKEKEKVINQPKRTKLTDKQKKKIIADYINNGNYSETARMNGVSRNAVKAIVLKDEDTALKCQQKKEENTKDILEYMDSITEDQKEIVNLSLQALKEKLKKPDAFTNVKDIVTVYGVIFDKAMKYEELKRKSNNSSDTRKTVIVDDLPKWD